MPRRITASQLLRNVKFSNRIKDRVIELHQMAGYSPKSVTYTAYRLLENASRLARNDKILARFDELKKKTEDESVMSVLERKHSLTGETQSAILFDTVLRYKLPFWGERR